MNPPDKEIPRSRRPRTLPPTSKVESTLPPTAEPDVVVPRFYEDAAQLSALSTQVRTLTQNKDKAVVAGRLARQLAHHRIETRDALALGEKSLAIFFDPDLGLDVSRWWCEAGDPRRGVRLAESVVDELPEGQRRQALLAMAKANIRLAQASQAARALRRVMDLAPQDPIAYELFGSMGFWSDLPKDECARALLRAAELRRSSGDESNAFESTLRAFEVDQRCTEAATALSTTLVERGRPGAAAEIFREHLRTASSAQRAAHHQRAFYAAFGEGKLEECIESALEAELDIDVDVERVFALALGEAPLRQDFESFLWKLISQQTWGQSNTLASWLLALCEIHRGSTSDERLLMLSKKLQDNYLAEPLEVLDTRDNADHIVRLRSELVSSSEPAQEAIRFELARRLCVEQEWNEALLVLSPLLENTEVGLATAAFGATLGGRTSNAPVRIRSMVALAPWLPPQAGAVTYAVAAERLLKSGSFEEAHQAADAAVEALPSNERAIATQALVALHVPDGASASLLEHSLSVLVARSDACGLLSELASQRGSSRLALTWAGRALALRPGDVSCAKRYLQQACSLIDATKIADALEEVIEQPLPLSDLQEEVCDCLTLLKQSGETQVIRIGERLLAAFSVEHELVFEKLHELAESVQVNELLATLIETKLISAEAPKKADLFLKLVKYRLASGQTVAAARALRKAQLNFASETEVKELRQLFSGRFEPDGRLALLEVDADLSVGVSEQERAERLFVLGCARWDMAHDSEQAVAAWLKAAELDQERGLELFAHYLRQVAGSESALEHLKEAARGTDDPARSGKLLGLAAREALKLERKSEAFRLASAALERAPLLADLLAIAEEAAGEANLNQLDRLYQLLADGAMGNFGERAVHYRAARQLEKRGALEAALTHACAAFEAEPAEGVAYVLMARLADATVGHSQLLDSIQRVADGPVSDAERARWLSLAAALSDTESIGRGERLEILFRAAQMQPVVETLEDLFDGIAHCLADEPGQREELWGRFSSLARDVFVSGRGEEGARRCLLFAATAVSHFEQPDFAVEAAIAAVACDLRCGEYGKLLPYVHQLAGIVGPATEFLELVRDSENEKDEVLGKELAELAGKIAGLLGERDVQAELTVRSASHFPEDAGLVNQAREFARDSGRPDLIAQVDELLPPKERAKGVLDRLEGMEPDEALNALLDLDVEQLEGSDRLRVLEESAHRLERIGRVEDAAVRYRALVKLDDSSQEGLLGLERHAEANGNHEELLQILARRIELSTDAGEIRRLTLRRAAALEMKLGRAPEARKLLQSFLAQGEDRAALRLLADSWQRTGDFTESAELWFRVHAVALDSIEADDAAYRAASNFSRAGLPRRAKEALANIERPLLHHLELSLEVARSVGDKDEIYSGIVRLCEVLVGDQTRQGELLLEAASLALAKKRINDAQRCADRALELIPDCSEAKLLVGRIRAQNGALCTSLQAEQMRQLLSGTESLEGAKDREMATFLRAKSLMLSGKKSEAETLLEDALVDQGERPLLSALLSELIVDDDERALQLVDVALGGQCHGFFSEGELLLRAGKLAQRLGDFSRARGLISAVSDDDPLRVRAARALEELSEARAKSVTAAHNVDASASKVGEENQLESDVQSSLSESSSFSPLDIATLDASLADLVVPSNEPTPPVLGEQSVPLGQPMDDLVASQSTPREEKISAQGERSNQSTDDAESVSAPTVEEIRRAAREEHRNAARAVSDHQELAGPRRVRRSSRPAMRAVVAASLSVENEESLRPAALPSFADESANTPGVPQNLSISDTELLQRLEEGDIEAGLDLLSRLHSDRSRSRDAVIVAQHLALLNPGDAKLLGRLVTAAYRDGNEPLAAAVRHILGAYGAGDPVDPPAPERVLDQNGAALALIKQAQGVGNEALALIWEHGSSFLRKELSDYGISGLERVSLHAQSLVGELAQGVSRVTGLVKPPIYRSSGQDEISIQVALLQTPSVIIAGQIEETSLELTYHFGAMIAACSAEHALVFGADFQRLQDVLSALSLSFGKEETNGRPRSADATRLASLLWESIPSRAQRRLSQLCIDASELNYGTLTGHSRLAVRRAGLISCGDLPTAVDDACSECNLPPPSTLSELSRVVSLCPAAADLLQLSLSSEYAQVRFQVAK